MFTVERSSRVNKVSKRTGYPLDGSSHILKRLNPENKFYTVCDLSMGYHQLELHPDSRDLFSIVLPRGKYRYACMPQGAGPSSDLFNIHTDQQLMTFSQLPLGQLEEKMEAIL